MPNILEKILGIAHEKDRFTRWFTIAAAVFFLLYLLLSGMGTCINHFSPPPNPPNTQDQPTGPKAAS